MNATINPIMTENKEKLVKGSLRQGALSVETLKIQTELPN